MIAPQASAASTVLAAAQCGQRVNEWGQAGGNSPPLMPPSGHDAGGELSPACPHVRLRHSRFAHTESAHADPAARSPHGRAVTSRVPTVDPTPEWRTPSDDGARSRSEEANLRIGGKSDLRSNRVSTELEPTHTERFTAILGEHYPTWREARAELNELPLAAEVWRE